LFTPSPLYPPYHQPPLLPETILLDQNMFEESSTYNGALAYNPADVAAVHEDLQPYLNFVGTFQDNALADYPVLKKVFENWNNAGLYGVVDPSTGLVIYPSIFGHKSKDYWWAAYYGIDNHLYFKDQLFRFLTTFEGTQADYSVPIFSFAVDDSYMAGQAGLAGLSDDNWVDGTPEYVYEWNTPYWAGVGYGFTETAIHEAGHHMGMSHPHDGYDPVYGEVYYTGHWVWSGDQSYTVMAYNDLTHNFGVFNKDSMWRYMTVVYLNYANKISGQIMSNPHAGDVAGMIGDADASATAALADYQNMNYLGAVTKMKTAYDTVVQAALSINIQIEPYNWHSAYKATTRTATSFTYNPASDPAYFGPD
jgi:hypothetical protein